MNEVMWRENEIQYASRSNDHIEAIVAKRNLDHVLTKSLEIVDSKQVPDVTSLQVGQKIDIVHITFNPLKGHIPLSDAEFSRRSIRLRRDAGFQDMKQAISESPWTKRNPQLPTHFHKRKSHGGWIEKVTKITKNKISQAS